MISLTCTHCQTVLSIDDAFAGGVCRCQHCGTIQTVPSHLKAGAAVKAGVADGQSIGGPKTLYQSQRAGRSEETGSGTGLEDLADVVASSGLGGSGLSSMKPRKPRRRPTESATTEAPVRRSRTPLLVVAGCLLAVVIMLTAYLLLTSRNKPTAGALGTGETSSGTADTGQVSGQPNATPVNGSPGNGAPANGEAPTAAAEPQFCGIPLSGNSIVYLVDRGDSAKENFDAMVEASFKSIQSLGTDRKFQLMMWDNGTSQAGFPLGSTTFATPENIDAARKALDDVTAEHQSTIDGPLKQAAAEAPDAIVIITAKGFELDDSFVAAAKAALGANPIKLFTVSIQSDGQKDCAPLQTLAKESGGAYKSITDGALRAAGAN